jgi:hypothetical protein
LMTSYNKAGKQHFLISPTISRLGPRRIYLAELLRCI